VSIAYVSFDCDCNRIACWKRLNERFIQQLVQVLGFSYIVGRKKVDGAGKRSRFLVRGFHDHSRDLL